MGSLAPFNVDVDSWKIYQEQLEQFLEVNKIKTDLKKSAFISCIGQDAYKLLRDLCTPDLPKNKSFEELCTLMENHFTPKINVFRERNNFYMTSQQEGESIADFTARIRNLSTNCNFGGDKLEGILIDKFVFGLKSGKIKDRICEEKPTSETTFSQIVEIALAKETYLVNEADQVNWIKNKKGQQVRQKQYTSSTEYKHSGSRHAEHGDRWVKNTGDQGAQKHWQFQSNGSSKISKARIKELGYQRKVNVRCAVNDIRVCKIVDIKIIVVICVVLLGHLARLCSKSKSTNFLNIESTENDTHESLIYNIRTYEVKPIILDIQINNIKLKAQLDSGSGLTVISEKTFHELFRTNIILKKVFKNVSGYTGEKINVLGFFLADV